MDDLLFLTHRIPFPPNKGDKIRSFHWLKGLSSEFRVHLGTFVDNPEDMRYVPSLNEYCHSVHVSRISTRHLLQRGLASLVGGQPVSVAMYRDTAMLKWVRHISGKFTIRSALAFSSGVAPYLFQSSLNEARRIIDFVDVDSDKWTQYAVRTRFAKRWIYTREGRLLRRSEAQMAVKSQASLFVSSAEAEFFRTRVATPIEVTAVENGVDCAFFDPELQFENPYPDSDRQVLLFTGAMDYAANADAVIWFAEKVFPLVRRTVPDIRFYIVGNRPTPAVYALADRPGIHVTGYVQDVRPYMAHATAAIAPMRIARGIQNKVLEALAMGRPVIATPQAAEGLESTLEFLTCVSEDPTELARSTVSCILDGPGLSSSELRRIVVRRYSWDNSLRRLQALLQGRDIAHESG